MGVYFRGLKLGLRTAGPIASFLGAFLATKLREKEKRKRVKKDGDDERKKAKKAGSRM